jgi:RNA polymerase sigma-70 factor (ECF subfamily)
MTVPESPTPDEPMPSDADLVAATHAGDRDAFGVLVLRHQDRLYNTLLRVLGSHHDASEVLQDAFIQAYSKLSTFRGQAKFSTWMYRVALNLACSHRRRRRPRETSLEHMKQTAGAELEGTHPLPEQAMIQQEQAEQVQAALMRVSREHRQILVLREIEDCSYEAIAEILAMPVGTVRSRLFRARLQLKAELETLLGARMKRVER